MIGLKIVNLTFVTIFMIIIHLVHSYSHGPPKSVCDSMEPDSSEHGSSPQNSQVPFQLVPEALAVEVFMHYRYNSQHNYYSNNKKYVNTL